MKLKQLVCVQNNKNSKSLMVTLPLDWVLINKLQKGDLLQFSYDENCKNIASVRKIEVN
jgi:hypothetical protein